MFPNILSPSSAGSKGSDGALWNVLLNAALTGEDPVTAVRRLGALPPDAQRKFDTEVTTVGTDGLVLIQDFMAAGLTTPLPEWLSVMRMDWEATNRVGNPKQGMLPGTAPERKMPDRELSSIPIYGTWDEFQFNLRLILASRRSGVPIDTSVAADVTLRINELIEYTGWHGLSWNVDGVPVYGIRNHPQAITTPISDWADPTTTGEDIIAEVQAMAGEAISVKRRGPFNLYIPTLVNNRFSGDYKSNSDKSILTRLQELQYGGRPLNIRSADQLGAGEVSLVEMRKNTGDVIVGQEPTMVSWEAGNGMERYFMILACIILRLKTDIDGVIGIVNATAA